MEKTEYIDLRGDGRIVLYQRPNLKNPRWEVRISVSGHAGYIRKSTKETNFRLAKAFAEDLYDDIRYKIKSGGLFKAKTYNQVFEEWESNKLTTTTKKGGSYENTIKAVQAYSLKYFGHMKIDTIDKSDFSKYWEWRKSNYNRSSPSNSTLVRERTCIRSLLSFCVERGYIPREIDIPKPFVDGVSKRPTFTKKEYTTLTRNLGGWVKEAEGQVYHLARKIFHQYFLILANTGMRIGELRNVTWEDLKPKTTKTDQLICMVDGKIGKREVVIQKSAEIYFERMFEYRKKFLGKTPDPDEVIFINYETNKPIKSLKKSFKSLLQHADVKVMKDGKNRSIYSLRHYYATRKIREDNISVYLLAQQMGTSVKMIEEYYGQVLTSEVADKIGQTRTKLKVKDTGGSYPWGT